MKTHHFYRRRLPHWQPAEGTFFITYRLAGSIPRETEQRLKARLQRALAVIELEEKTGMADVQALPPNEREEIKMIFRRKRQIEHTRHFEALDHLLDTCLNEPHWLKNPEIARLVGDSIQFAAGKSYTLWAYTIMSNHVHLLLTMLHDAPVLWRVLQNSKKYTGLHANRLLGRTGTFWESESYDHWLREGLQKDPGEFDRILWYILNNPVKAGLAADWRKYGGTYCNPAVEFDV